MYHVPIQAAIRLFSTLLLLCLGSGCMAAAPLQAERSVAAAPASRQAKPADRTVDQGELGKLPIQEVTVFKDGHAFVLHEGVLEADSQGRVHLGHLPTPVIGTFWPYVTGKHVQLTAVVAGKQKVRRQRTALSIRELLEANIGAKVHVKQQDMTYAATVVSIPQPKTDQHAASEGNQPTARTSEVIVLKTAEGYRIVPLASIQEVTFADEPSPRVDAENWQNLLSLQLRWKDQAASRRARVGMVYLQRGLRWIPNYKLELKGKGKLAVRLQATLINELSDLENVTANLVIGVPNFFFKETVDPIALGQTTAQLSQYFRQGSQTAFAFSNALQTQVARMGEYRAPPSAQPSQQPVDLGPDLASGEKSEDLFVFTVAGISLRKGERMVVPVAEYELDYEDVYTVKLSMAPPPELLRHFNSNQQKELASLFLAPKAIHQLRITNRTKYPLTTAPALIVQDGRLLGQGLMTYTAVGGRVDVEITKAVDIAVRKSDLELKRTPNAARWSDTSFDRIDLSGEVSLHNYRSESVEVEVVRLVLGNVDTLGADGKHERVNIREDGWLLVGGYPNWWHWYSWPVGWFHLNGVSRIQWTVTVQPGQHVTLPYTWHYFWRG